MTVFCAEPIGSIIAITAYSQERFREQAVGAGIDLHLTKPVSINELLKHVRETPKRLSESSNGSES